MTLVELQDVLGERVFALNNSSLTDEERKEEIERSEAIARIAKQMINNADVILRTEKLRAEGQLPQNSAIVKVVNK